METKTWTWTSKSGTEVSVSYDLNGGLTNGKLVNSAGEHKVGMPGKVQGQTVITFVHNGKPAHQLLPSRIYDAIHKAGREAYQASASASAAYDRNVAALEIKWRAAQKSDSVADEIAARYAYHKALAAWQTEYPDEPSGAIRWNDHKEITDDNILSL